MRGGGIHAGQLIETGTIHATGTCYSSPGTRPQKVLNMLLFAHLCVLGQYSGGVHIDSFNRGLQRKGVRFIAIKKRTTYQRKVLGSLP